MFLGCSRNDKGERRGGPEKREKKDFAHKGKRPATSTWSEMTRRRPKKGKGEEVPSGLLRKGRKEGGTVNLK